jgi:polyisoprenyl-teichoic acid--peptidoglycan teichoic acid transferase
VTRTYRSARPATDPLRHPDDSPPEVRSKRAYWLILMTLVVPGSAQVVAGNRRLGRLGLRVFLGVLAAAVVALLVAWVERALLFSLFTRTPVLLLLTIVLVFLAGLWAVLFLDAWRLARPSRLPGAGAKVVSALTAVLLLCTSGSLLYGGFLVSAQRNLISTVFGDGAAQDAVDGRYNVLLIGGDAGDDRVGLRNDSNNVVSIDADTGAAVQIGIPRNLADAPFPPDSPMAKEFPDGFDADEGLFNAIYKYGAEHPRLYPDAKDPGAEAVKDAAEGVTGLQVQYYALIDLRGFEALVDAMGGIEMDVKTRVPKAAVTQKRATDFIEPGRQRLDGADALWFARSRFGSSDYERMARQRCVMSAMLAQLDPQTVLLRFQDIAKASEGVISTDIPESHLGDFVDLALKAKGQSVTSVQLVPPAVDTSDPDFDVTRTMVADGIAASEGANDQADASPTVRQGKDQQLGGDTIALAGSTAPEDLAAVCSS